MGNGRAVCVRRRGRAGIARALLVFRLLPRGFSNRNLCDHWAPLLGKAPDDMTSGQMTYHLRRLRLHSLIERIPGTHRYRVTRLGWCTALFCTRTYNRILRPGLAQIVPIEAMDDSKSNARASTRLIRSSTDRSRKRKMPV